MNLQVLAGTRGCKDGNCPTTYETDLGSNVVQGYGLPGDAVHLSEGQSVVEVPAELVADTAGNILDGTTGKVLLGSGGTAYSTDRGTIVISGRTITDPDVLSQLDPSPGELLVEVSPEMLQRAVHQLRFIQRQESRTDAGFSAHSALGQ